MSLWRIAGKVDGERASYAHVEQQDLQDFLMEEVKRIYPGASGRVEIDYRQTEIVLRATSDQGTTILRCYQEQEETK